MSLPWRERVKVFQIGVIEGDGPGLIAYLNGARALTRGEAERVADMVVGQVARPIAGLYEELARLTDAINEVSAQVADIHGRLAPLEAAARSEEQEPRNE